MESIAEDNQSPREAGVVSSQVPIQVYRCPVHKEFEVTIPFSEKVPKTMTCLKGIGKYKCFRTSKHVIKAPAAAYVKGGGTGGGQQGRR